MIAGTFTFWNENDLLVHQIETLLSFCDFLVIQGDNPPEETEEIARSYEKDGLVYLIINRKKNNFWERDELGDRERLLVTARNLGALATFHTDVDEIVRVRDVPKVISLLKDYNYDTIIDCYRYDLWYNAHNYRIPYDSTKFSGRQISNILPPCRYTYIFPTAGASYGSSPIPNYHCNRLPYSYGNRRIPHILNTDIQIIHFGYYKKRLVEAKGRFYNTDKSVTGDVWGKDMQVDDKEFIKNWGMGVLNRNDHE